jgi:hypothetical protein
VASKKKRSLGRDPFEDDGASAPSRSVEKLIKGRPTASAEAREVSVNVRLTPANIKHLDALRRDLAAAGKGDYSRNDLIRIAIALLSAGDVG